MDIRLGRIQQQVLAAREASSILGCSNRRAGSRWREVISPIYSVSVGSYLDTVFSFGPLKTRKTLAPQREAEGAGLVQPQEETLLGDPNSSIPLPVTRPSRRWSLAFLSGAMWENKRRQAEAETREVHTGCEEEPLHHEETPILEHLIQRRSHALHPWRILRPD